MPVGQLIFVGSVVPEPVDLPRLCVEDPVTRRELDLMRERHQILYQMILDVSEEIDSLRERLNVLCQLWRERS